MMEIWKTVKDKAAQNSEKIAFLTDDDTISLGKLVSMVEHPEMHEVPQRILSISQVLRKWQHQSDFQNAKNVEADSQSTAKVWTNIADPQLLIERSNELSKYLVLEGNNLFETGCLQSRNTDTNFWIVVISHLISAQTLALPSKHIADSVVRFLHFLNKYSISLLYVDGEHYTSLRAVLKVSGRQNVLPHLKKIVVVDTNKRFLKPVRKLDDIEIIHSVYDPDNFSSPTYYQMKEIENDKIIFFYGSLTGSIKNLQIQNSDKTLEEIHTQLTKILNHEKILTFYDITSACIALYISSIKTIEEFYKVQRSTLKYAIPPVLIPIVELKDTPLTVENLLNDYFTITNQVKQELTIGYALEVTKILLNLVAHGIVSSETIDLNKPVSSYNFTSAQLSIVSNIITRLGFDSSVMQTTTDRFGTILANAVMTRTVISNSSDSDYFSIKIIDNSTNRDEVAQLLGDCFSRKNRLDLSVGNPASNNIKWVKHIWPEILQCNASVFVTRKNATEILGTQIAVELQYDEEIPGITENANIIIALLESEERPLREFLKGTKVALACMAGTHADKLNHDQNLCVMKLLLDGFAQQAKNNYNALCSMNTHLVTKVIFVDYLSCTVAATMQMNTFVCNDSKPFKEMPDSHVLYATLLPL